MEGEQSRGERRGRGVVGGSEEGILGVSGGGPWFSKRQEQTLDQPANVEGNKRKEENQDQAGQHQVRENTEQDLGAVQAER